MSKIKIEDLPVMQKMDQKQAKGIFGGALMEPTISRDVFSGDSFSLSGAMVGTKLEGLAGPSDGKIELVVYR